MSIESVMPSNHLILCHPLLLLPSVFPSIRVFSGVTTLCIMWPKYWSFSASASVFPVNIQGWFPLGLTGLILPSKGLSRIFSSTSFWKHQFFSAQPSLWSNSHIHTWHDYWKNHSFDLCQNVKGPLAFVGKVMSLLFNTLAKFVTLFLQRNKCLLTLWLQ